MGLVLVKIGFCYASSWIDATHNSALKFLLIYKFAIIFVLPITTITLTPQSLIYIF